MPSVDRQTVVERSCTGKLSTNKVNSAHTDTEKEKGVARQSSFDLPDLNLLRISMECSEPRRVIMLTVQFQCSKVAK